MEVVGIVEVADDEFLDPDLAVDILEVVSSHLGRLEPSDRGELARLWTRLAAERPVGPWRDLQLAAPAAMGLVDEVGT